MPIQQLQTVLLNINNTKKGYSIFPRAPEEEPHHQMHFSAIPYKLNRMLTDYYISTFPAIFSEEYSVRESTGMIRGIQGYRG